MPKAISDTFLYRNMNKGGELQNTVIKILKDSTPLVPTDLDEALIIINRYKFPLKAEVLDSFANDEIRLVYPTLNTKLPSYMPFFLTKDHGKIVSIIDASVYGTKNADGKFRIDPKKLYCLMEGAYLSRLYYMHENAIKQKSKILMKGASMYSSMFTRVLNKQFSINVDKDKYQKILFLASKFYLINVIGLKDGDMVFNYAIKNTTSLSVPVLNDIHETFDEKYFKDFASFIEGLVINSDRLNLGLEELTARGFIETYIMMYDSAALLALEYFPYFVYNAICVINGAYINNQKLLEQVIGNDAAAFYSDLIMIAH